MLVTGASGYIALHCIKQLLEQGYTVRGTVRNTKDDRKVAPINAVNMEAARSGRLELVEADLLKETGWNE